MEGNQALNAPLDSNDFRARLLEYLASIGRPVDLTPLPDKLKSLLQLPESLDPSTCGNSTAKGNGHQDCWVLDHLVGLNEVVSHSRVELTEEQPGVATLKAWKPCPRSRFSRDTFSQDAMLFLVKHHRCIKHFYWGKTKLEMTNCILKALSGRKDVLSFSITEVLLSRDHLLYRRDPMPKCIPRRIVDLVKGCELLETFELHEMKIRESFAEELGAALAAKRSLKKLGLSSEHTIRAFLRNWNSKLSEDVDDCVGVVSLTLKNCNTPELAQLAQIIELNSSISHLDLGGDEWHREIFGGPKDDGVAAIAKALRWNTTIKTLDLEDLGFGPKGGVALAKMLCKNRTITHLNIRHNSIRCEAAVLIAYAIRDTRALKELKMQGCGAGLVGIQYILKALKKNKSGLIVDFGDCWDDDCTPYDIRDFVVRTKLDRVPFIWSTESIVQHGCVPHWCTDVRIGLCPSLAKGGQLDALYAYLSWGSAKVKSLSLLSIENAREDCLRVADILSNGSKFEELSVETAPIPMAVLARFSAALQSNTSIRKLRFGMLVNGKVGTPIPVGQAEPLAGLLKENKTLESLECNLIFNSSAVKEFSEKLEENYALIDFQFYTRDNGDCVVHKRHHICRRNRVLQEQATHFLLRQSMKKRWAEAFSLTYDASVLKRRVAKESTKSEDEVQQLIKAKWYFLRASFFSIVGIVKRKIQCHPTEDRATQIDALNFPCLVRIAGFLHVRDVK